MDLSKSRDYWFDVLKYPWLTRKLRRKIGHLHQLDLLPIIYKPLASLYTYPLGDNEFWAIFDAQLAKKFMEKEDQYILKGDV